MSSADASAVYRPDESEGWGDTTATEAETGDDHSNARTEVETTDKKSRPRSEKAKHALCCGILSLFSCGIILGPIAMYLAIEAEEDIKRAGLRGRRVSEIGFALGMTGLGLSIFLIVIILRFFV